MNSRFWEWMHNCSLTVVAGWESAASRTFQVDCDIDIGAVLPLRRFQLTLRGVAECRLDLVEADGTAHREIQLADVELTILTVHADAGGSSLTVFADAMIQTGAQCFATLHLKYDDEKVVLPGLPSIGSHDLVAMLETAWQTGPAH